MFWATNGTSEVKVYDEDELSRMVFSTIKWYKEFNEQLAVKNKELHDNAEAIIRHEYEAEIAHLKERLSMSYGEFSSQKEKDAYKDFSQRHMHDRMEYKMQHSKVPYLIPHPVGVGISLEVVCPICGEKEDITDVSVW